MRHGIRLLYPASTEFSAGGSPETKEIKIVPVEMKAETGLDRLASAVRQKALPTLALVDEDTSTALRFLSALKAVKAQVQFVHLKNQKQALRYLQGQGPFADRNRFPLPSLTVLSLRESESQGLTTLAYIRSHASTSRSLVIILASSNIRDEIRKASLLEVSAYIVKPTEERDFQEMIRHIKLFWLDTLGKAQIT